MLAWSLINSWANTRDLGASRRRRRSGSRYPDRRAKEIITLATLCLHRYRSCDGPMTTQTAVRRFGLTPMLPRDDTTSHRAASNLECLFDLVFVIAVSLSSTTLHELELENHIWQGVTGYLMVFFAIWWAWMNFTWFATSFDNDDWLYRITTFVQMAGALVIAAGAGPAMTEGDITWLVIGYLIMRLVSVPQWLRVARRNPDYRQTALRYAIGITFVQLLWIAAVLVIPHGTGLWVFLPLVVLELLIPVIAERARPTPWHPHHITERYGLFTLILLGESILASANAVITAIDHTEHLETLLTIAVTGLIIVAAMWWTYFARSMHERIKQGLKSAMTFGYFHYAIFAAAGAFSAGVEVAVAAQSHHIELGDIGVRATLAIPVACFFLGVWWLALRPTLAIVPNVLIVALTIAMVLSIWVAASSIVIAVCAVIIVVILEVHRDSEAATN